MDNSTLIFGPPGCGKTYTLIQEVEDELARGTHPSRIGYCSFTRKAVGEAVDRACAKFNLTSKELPFFRTLNSWGFRGLGLNRDDMMSMEDWAVLGMDLGMRFTGTSALSLDDGMTIPPGTEQGDRYAQLVMRARHRQISLEMEYNLTRDHSLNFAQLERVSAAIQNYKLNMHKLDFVDQIEQYIAQVDAPHLDLFIVDEAQDLTPLQWEMVRKIAEHAERVVIAGDDDQAIHRWTGVDVNRFLGASPNYRVLNQSYRMPRNVHKLSQDIVRRISNRREKQFDPTERDGRVDFLMNEHELDLTEGSWTLMARTNRKMHSWAEQLRADGYLYSKKGKSSINRDMAEVVVSWRQLQRRGALTYPQVLHLYDNVPKMGDAAVVKRGSRKLLDAASPDAMLTYDTLVGEYGMIAPLEREAYDVARMGKDTKNYVRAIERRGEDILAEPRIKVSTFHGMKGGEDDNCAVSLESTWACVNTDHPDDEHRAMYVGVTRARNKLCLIDTDSKYRYSI
jgi:superfamily I DNA/RNA helicase